MHVYMYVDIDVEILCSSTYKLMLMFVWRKRRMREQTIEREEYKEGVEKRDLSNFPIGLSG